MTEDVKDTKLMKEAVQCWAEAVAIHIANSARGLSKYDAHALKQLFDWPQMLDSTLPIQEMLEKLDERISK